jgi:hypothetical protein
MIVTGTGKTFTVRYVITLADSVITWGLFSNEFFGQLVRDLIAG